MPDGTEAHQPAICAVIVLYRKSATEAVALQSLISAYAAVRKQDLKFEAIVYDNSPQAGDASGLPPFVHYVSDADNAGLARAYNFALSRALDKQYDWLLTLDQDTVLPEDFLLRMIEHVRTYGTDPSIGAIVPQLSEGEVRLSPRRAYFARSRALPHGYLGIGAGEVHAFNSATFWRVQALAGTGGFCEFFWLDHLDLWTHRELYEAGYRVFVAGDLQLQHSLSLLDYKARLTPARYANFLEAESAFTDLCKPPQERAALTCRLFFRLLRQRKRQESLEIRKLTFRCMVDRVLKRKGERIARWKTRMMERPGTDNGFRPAVSVCMAAHNGERYIADQLRSILVQLSGRDEIIVVDDASTDRTRECVCALGDPRIRLIVHRENLGILQTFEDAVREARNGIIFLTDQDDLWRHDKIEKIVRAFADHPEVSLIASAVRLIDDAGNPIAGESKPFHSGFCANLIRNRWLGCSMVFRARIRRQILPFPRGFDVLHDIWIGTRNSLSGGNSLYIDDPLVFYRRHDTNATGRSRLGMGRRLRVRLHLLRALAAFQTRRRSNLLTVNQKLNRRCH